MSKYEFDKPINRYGTDCIKFDFKKDNGKDDDVIPMWVADTDFEIPREAAEAIRERAKHPIYGYTEGGDDYYDSLRDWMWERHGYRIENEWVINTPGVVFGFTMAIRRFTAPGEAVMILTPVYHPFYTSVTNNGRKLVEVPLTRNNEAENGYAMDYDQIEQEIIKNKVKVFNLCNPQNPVGRVWTREELVRLGEILCKHDVLIISDEIHMDFVYEGYRHTVFASISQEFEDRTITCTAPSKVFNIAGLQQANIIISNKEIREAFVKEVGSTGYIEPNVFGMIASRESYAHGAEYVDQMMATLTRNRDYVMDFIKRKMPKARVVKPEGTYLLWVDFNGYGYGANELNERIEHVAKLWFNDGRDFGEEGSGYMRINIATSFAVIKEACERMLLI